MPVAIRSGSLISASSPTSWIARPPVWRLCFEWNGVAAVFASSTSVFHSLQSLHCPAQRCDTDPQA